MKLAGKDIRRLQARTELGLTVTRGGKDHAGILRLAVIRVHEVHVFTITDVLKQRVLPHSGRAKDPVPSYLWNLEPGARVLPVRKAHDFSRNQVKPAMPSELVAFGHQELHTQANAEQRLSRMREVANGLYKIELPESLHRGSKGTNSRKDDSASIRDFGSSASDDGIQPGLPTGLMDAEQVPQSVVDDGYGRHGISA